MRQAPSPRPARACRRERLPSLSLGAVAISLAACMGLGPLRWYLGGTVTGLAGTGLVLHSSRGEDLPVASDGTFTFVHPVPSGERYTVTVAQQPSNPTQQCSVVNGTGTMPEDGGVTDVKVVCSSLAFWIRGTVTGLEAGGLVLGDGAGDELAVAADRAFAFPTPIPSGLPYEVTVKAQPGPQLCKVVIGAEKGTVGGADVSVPVTCGYRLGGNVSGLRGSGLVLRNNGADDLTLSQDGEFSFGFPVSTGAPYGVTVQGLPPPPNPEQTCTVSAASGRMPRGDLRTVDVVCALESYPVSARVSGLRGTGLVLRNNGAGDLPVPADGTFTFAAHVASGGGYEVTVQSQPASAAQPVQLCAVTGGTGRMGRAQVVVDVRCRAWGVPQRIDGGQGGASSPQLAVDAAGNALVVWTEPSQTPRHIWANRYTAGTGWGTAQAIETQSANAVLPQLAVDRSGNALAAWAADGAIWSSRYTPSGGWSSTAQLMSRENTTLPLHTGPQLGFDPSGNALAVWTRSSVDGGSCQVWANRYSPGTGWGTDLPGGLQQLMSCAAIAYGPQIAVDNLGNAFAIWVVSTESTEGIYVSKYSPGGGWEGARWLQAYEEYIAMNPRLTFDPTGNALAVWEQGGNDDTRIWSNRYSRGSGWAGASQIGLDWRSHSPQIASDTAGNAIVVWSQSDGTRFSVWSGSYNPSNGWGPTQAIESNHASYAGNPHAAMDSPGNALAVWHHNDGIWANRYSPSGGWGTEQLIGGDSAGWAIPNIAFDASGNALAVWEGASGAILASRFE